MGSAPIPDPEVASAGLLARTGQQAPPTNLLSIVGLWDDLQVREESLDGEGYLLHIPPTGGEIVVKSESPLSRKRFTLAHELGHWFLKKNAAAKRVNLDHGTNATIERWCDHFAASLLMPRDWMLRELSSRRPHRIVSNVASAPRSRYQVSDQAFRLRVSEIAAVSVFELAASSDGVFVVHKCHSPHLAQDAAETALRQLLVSLADGVRQQVFLYPSLGLQSVHGGLPGGWLACFFPWHDPAVDASTPGNGQPAREN